MATPKDTVWEIAPHTRAKHEILKRYLQAWFPILNKHHDRILYVDGFCGPGCYKGGEPGSPIVALEAAAEHRRGLRGDLVFLFVDEREDRLHHLKSVLKEQSIPKHFDVRVKHGVFESEFAPLLESLEQQARSSVPTFVFVDPFGFKGIPFRLIERLLAFPRCEVLITFMVDAVNRFLEHPEESIVAHIVSAFGTKKCISIAKGGGDRVAQLRTLYQEQLESAARFVRYFEMRDRPNHAEYLLFFATNHRMGHVKMKEAMWRVDPEAGYYFSDAAAPDQLLLEDETLLNSLRTALRRAFQDAGQVSVGRIAEYVEDKTMYLQKHMRKVLKGEEAAGKIHVSPHKVDGTKRRKGTFSEGTMVEFLSEG